ncbi:Manganese-dependent inorganic pyrophosphatase [Chitinispirillum alkaliphilum]|nr:Manganese-dependent inorganic pyrophosphatase [Chitinispirillum alkaliphilum]
MANVVAQNTAEKKKSLIDKTDIDNDLSITPVHVLGHLNPDTDSIASAIGYAWLLRERDGKNAIAARPGAIAAQTSWLLDLIGLEAPKFLTDASPRFERIARCLPPVAPDRPLREAWSASVKNSIGVPIVQSDNTPVGIVTGDSVFNFISQQIEHLVDLESVSVARLLSAPSRDAMDRDVPKFSVSMRVRDGRRKATRTERNDFLVVNEDGTYFGVCRSPDILNPPRMQLVLVDHNETTQSIRAIEEADIVEVIDHHRLGSQITKTPIPFTIDTVGSTSTLVSERIISAGLEPPRPVAAVLLAGILSDTLIHSSPTTTPRDQKASEMLSEMVFGSDWIPYGNYREFGEALLSVGSGLSALSIEDIVSADLKEYSAGGIKFGIAQVEVGSLVELGSRLEEIKQELDNQCKIRGFDFVVLMVTDIVRAVSKLVCAGQTEVLNDLPYTRAIDGTLEATRIVSRKKQLLPAILGLVE